QGILPRHFPAQPASANTLLSIKTRLLNCASSKEFLVRTPCICIAKDTTSGSLDYAPIDILAKTFSQRSARDDRSWFVTYNQSLLWIKQPTNRNQTFSSRKNLKSPTVPRRCSGVSPSTCCAGRSPASSARM